MTNLNYKDFFEQTTGNQPYPWQQRFQESETPELVNIPTGLGKTAGVGVAWLFDKLTKPEATPRRLVWCLPMRVLVEQTVGEFTKWVNKTKHLFEEKGLEVPTVHIMMGGAQNEEWESHPDKSSVIIGTQDMLLSRALMRGYGMSKYRWPIHFSFLNNDALWVFDETQLMGVGVETSAQLDAFRKQVFETYRPTHSIWMSATLDTKQLETVDHLKPDGGWNSLSLSNDDLEYDNVRQRIYALKTVEKLLFNTAPSEKNYASKFVDHILGSERPSGDEQENFNIEMNQGLHVDGTLTLIVVNQVKRAISIFEALQKRVGTEKKIGLIHSRFRLADRTKSLALLNSEGDRIIVATQVVEAGVDCSAQNLITEICPWPSFVQRVGRCNRYGEYADAKVGWIDIPEATKENEFKEGDILPYSKDDLQSARQMLSTFTNASPDECSKQAYDTPEKIRPVIRKKDILALFDTTPDLTGMDLDIARWIRDNKDTDVSFFWRTFEGTPEYDSPKPIREEMCSVPIGQVKKFLDSNDKKDISAYIFDHLERRWIRTKNQPIFPGMQVMLNLKAGGYDAFLGWTGKPLRKGQALLPIENQSNGIIGQEDDPRSCAKNWYLLNDHLTDVENETQKLCESIGIHEGHSVALQKAARWHDVGKAHPAFQDKLIKPAEAANEGPTGEGPWAKSNGFRSYRSDRPGFRHELASALAYLQHFNSDKNVNLVTYLIMAHHGKVRMAIRSLPKEKPKVVPEYFALGVYHNDLLPSVDLGNGEWTKEVMLDLSIMSLGEGSWRERTGLLLSEYGPFVLGYLESLLRIGDWRGSKRADDIKEGEQ